MKIIWADGREPLVVGKIARLPVKKGDLVRLVTGTGGGYGDPYERPIEKVVEDVRDGYITPEMARDQYGVVVDPETLQVLELVGKRAQKVKESA
jgi:N-methylhydantoinase B